MKAVVYKSTGSWYWVKLENNHWVRARIKGKFKIDDQIKSTNPIAVGDVVEVVMEQGSEEQAMISNIYERSNYIVRLSPHNIHQKHIVASNIDQAFLICSIKEPQTSLGFIDRFLLSAELYHIPAFIIVNKIDLLTTPEELAIWKRWEQIYTAIGYNILAIHAFQERDIDLLKSLLQGKKTLFSGHSGVGKSTLINQIVPQYNLKTEVVSSYSGKGQHTTTFAEMFDLNENSALIDTPGLKEFGIVNVQQQELAQYFPEMKQLAAQCKYHNCQHINEPKCAVKQALSEGLVAEERYVNYIQIWESIATKW